MAVWPLWATDTLCELETLPLLRIFWACTYCCCFLACYAINTLVLLSCSLRNAMVFSELRSCAEISDFSEPRVLIYACLAARDSFKDLSSLSCVLRRRFSSSDSVRCLVADAAWTLYSSCSASIFSCMHSICSFICCSHLMCPRHSASNCYNAKSYSL